MEVRPGYKQSDVGVIPEDWDVTDLESCLELLTDFEANGSFESVAQNVSVYDSEGYAWYVRATDLENRTDPCKVKYVDRASYQFLKKTPLFGGEVLITKRGEIGKVYFFLKRTERATLGPNLYLLKLQDKVIPYYIYSFFRFGFGNKQLTEKNASTTLGALYKDDVKAIWIPLPPTEAEQEAIAEALRDADALIESLEQLIAKKRHLKQGGKQELLTGKKRLPGFGGEWKLTQLGDVAAFYKGRGLPKSALGAFSANLCIHYGELFTRYPETIREVIGRTNGSQDSFCSVANDVLMPTSDVTPNGLAKASCIGMGGVILGGDILIIRSDADFVFGPFLSYLIRHEQEQILQLVTGTTVFHLYAADMKKFTFLMPSLDEQRAIASVLDDIDSEIAALDAKLVKARQIKWGMMQELLTGRIRLI